MKNVPDSKTDGDFLLMKEFYNVYPVVKGQFEYFDYMLPGYIKSNRDMKYVGAVNSKGYPSGVMAYIPGFDKTVIEFIGVIPRERGKGAAYTMLRAFIMMLESSGINTTIELMWSEEYNGIFAPLVRKLPDFYITEDDSILNISFRDIAENPICKKIMSLKIETVEFFSLPNIERKNILGILKEKNLAGFIDREEDCIKELCLCNMKSKGDLEPPTLNSIITYERGDDNSIILAFLYVSERDPMALGAVVGESFRRIGAKYKGMGISMDLINKKSRELAEGVFGKNIKFNKLYTAIRFGKI